MNSQAKEARDYVELCERTLADAKQKLARIERNCKHKWGGPISDPIIHPAFTIPREEGMGSHPPRPAFHAPEKREPRWCRRCLECGMVEYTSKFETKTTSEHVPQFKEKT